MGFNFEVPWKAVDVTVIERHPSFPIEELNKACILAIGLLHASLQPQGSSRRLHLTLWSAALLGGIGSDVIFSYLPLVDNFFHAQATVMIYPRLPAYIVCFYIGWMYVPMALTWQLGLPPVTESVVCAFLCFAYYAPWDVVGVKHLWWTWHDSDSSFKHRYLNVPVVSSMFVVIQTFCWARLVRISIGSDSCKQYERPLSLWRAVAVNCAVIAGTVPGMVTLMQTLQSIFNLSPVPEPASASTFWKTVLTLATLGILCFHSKRRPARISRYNSLLFLCVVLHLGWMFVCGWYLDSTKETSVGVHQTYGDCYEEVEDLMGTRRLYICEELFTQDFKFRCGDRTALPPNNSTWYTICGTPKLEAWRQGMAQLTVACAVPFVVVFFILHFSPKESSSSKSKAA